MSTKKSKKIKYNVGDVFLVKSFAGPEVYKKVLKKINRTTTMFDKEINVRGFEGCFTRKKDILALKNESVPYTGKEAPSKCISFVYDWQIIKKIR